MISTVALSESCVSEVSFRSEMIITDRVSQAEWDDYVRTHIDGTPDHLWAWQTIFAEVFKQRSVYLAAVRDGAIVGVLPLTCFHSHLFGRLIMSLPYLNYGGVLASDEAAARELLAESERVARQFRASAIELRHQSRTFAELPCREHKASMKLPLPRTDDELWDTTDRKVRNQVRKAQKEGLVAVDGGHELVDEFYAVFSRNMRDLGTPVYPKKFFTCVLEHLKGGVRLHVVRYQGRATAAALCVQFARSTLVPWASSLREHRHLCSNMLLYWSMLQSAIAGRASTFDFGRSTRGAGTYRFKQQWGAIETPLHWEYLLLRGRMPADHGTTNPRFAAAIKLWQQLPLAVANRLGPWIVRNIP